MTHDKAGPGNGDKVWTIRLEGTGYFLLAWGLESSDEFNGEYQDLVKDYRDARLFASWSDAKVELNSMPGLHADWQIELRLYRDHFVPVWND